MGRLHEMIRTNGTQRRCQEIFQASGGVSSLQRMPFLLANLDSDPTCSFTLVDAVTELQFAVACATEELFSMLVDEVNWGHTFSKWSKAAGVCDIGSSGSDCPLFVSLAMQIAEESIPLFVLMTYVVDARWVHRPGRSKGTGNIAGLASHS